MRKARESPEPFLSLPFLVQGVEVGEASDEEVRCEGNSSCRSSTIIIHLPAIRQLGAITAIIAGFVSDSEEQTRVTDRPVCTVMASRRAETIKRLADPPVIVDSNRSQQRRPIIIASRRPNAAYPFSDRR